MGQDMQVTTFQTADTPNVVQEFYRSHLTQQGWTLGGQDNEALLLDNKAACPLYGLYIGTTVITTTPTTVELRLSSSPCMIR
jgi:hypothetical protein